MDALNGLWFYVGLVGIAILIRALTTLFSHLVTRDHQQEDET